MYRIVTLLSSFVLVVTLVVVMLTWGDYSIPISELFGGKISSDSAEWNILIHLRLPRALMALACGALLSMSGSIMQSVFNNPLVEPYTMGLSGGAVVGVGVAWILGFVGAGASLFAFIGALISMLIVLFLRQIIGGKIETMLLVGVVVSFVMSSANMLIFSLASHEFTPIVLYWSLGSLDAVDENFAFILFYIALFIVVLSPFLGKILDVLSAGEVTANHVGIDANRFAIFLFVFTALLTALSVASVGVVAFVGMIVPHIVKRIVGYAHCWIVPLSGILGGAFLLGCDMMACRIIYPAELPVGVFSGILGGLFFLFILLKNRNNVVD